jgi:uncharacterized MAPEG superfamily protein
MTIAYWTVLIAALLPIVFAGVAKAGAPSYDNREPRRWLDGLQGWRRRANWAQNNSHEAFPPFAAAVIIAQLAGGSQTMVDALALLYLGFRVAYGVLYMADRHVPRSLAWLAAMACVIGLFITAAAA